MKVFAFDYEPSTKRGGQERSLYDILCGLKERGHQVTLGYVIKGNLLDEYGKKGIQTVQVKRFSIVNKLSIKQWVEFIISIMRIKDVKGNVIYINQIMDLPLAAVLKKIKGAKKLVCHLRLPPLHGNFSLQKNQLSLLISYVDQFIVATVNMQMEHQAHGIPFHKMYIIPNIFKFNRIIERKPINKSNFKIAYIGRIDVGKGIKELIYIVPSLKKKYPGITLTIAGNTMNKQQTVYLNECKEIIDKLNLKNAVFFAGHQQDPVVFLKDFDLTLFPTTWNESFGRVLVESIMAGVPVIARDISSTAEILNDKSKQWVFKSKEELIKRIEILVDNPDTYPLDEIRKYQISTYSLEKNIKKIEYIMQN